MSDNVIWSKRVRMFHWVNALLVIGLIVTGAMISGEFMETNLGLSHDFSESVIPYHIFGLGIFFFSLLAYRLYVAFTSSDRGESIDEINPFTKENIEQFKRMSEHEGSYKYHNPVGRLMVAAWFVVLSCQAVTGAVLAVEHLTESDSMASIAVSTAYAHGSHEVGHEVGQFSAEVGQNEEHEEESFVKEVHESIMYMIVIMLVLHLAGVVKESIRIKNNLVEKMIHGK